MVDAKKALTDWMVDYINGRDAILKNLKKIEKNQEGFELKISYEDKDEYVMIEPFIGNFDDVFSRIDSSKSISIVLFNANENFDVIIENWKRLIDFEKLTIYFVNMFSETEKKWIIRPHLHNKIADDSSLKSGLKSMFSMVDPITELIVERKNIK